ncbi:universal stress protein [Salipiger mucosus]|uniref:Universal stress protein (Usp) n=1 Tax=Salipiger mucosus DSM 16094 TaxID=1123237 RepID=S9Q4G6_9RHOB|nr:universal stress protein [Salipiger mucosus]EPX76226.1 Universal stress protein (Usp) [Salipiger mucosus DSM 16094]
MFNRIMVPIDLTHADKLEKALDVAGDLAAHYGATLIYVGVTTEQPSSIAHTPAEFAEKLEAFAKEKGKAHGTDAESKAYSSHDPSIDLDDTLLKAVGETGADLVVMASHIPNVTDYIWPSNGGTIAGHSKASVMVVR